MVLLWYRCLARLFCFCFLFSFFKLLLRYFAVCPVQTCAVCPCVNADTIHGDDGGEPLPRHSRFRKGDGGPHGPSDLIGLIALLRDLHRSGRPRQATYSPDSDHRARRIFRRPARLRRRRTASQNFGVLTTQAPRAARMATLPGSSGKRTRRSCPRTF